MNNAVVVTGMGLVSAAGSSVAALQASLARQKHCLSPISGFETAGLSATHAGEVGDFAPLANMSPSQASTRDRGTQMALVAARQALDAAALDSATLETTGVAIGVSGSPQYQNMRVAPDRAYPTNRLGALYAARATPNFQADVLARAFGLGGPRFAFGSASLGGVLALSHAMELLRSGHAPALLVGGGEIHTLMNALGMGALGVTATGPCTPFSGSGGICFGEGAAFFVLELYAQAERRGASCLGELVAAGLSADAYGDVAQDPSGQGLLRAIRKTFEKSGSDLVSIGWVRACGTGQRELDAAEAIALDTAFNGETPPVTSTEPYFSHVNGVSPLLGLVAVLSAMSADRAPCLPEPSLPRPGLALRFLSPGKLPEGDCLLTATAFGGTNGAVQIRAPAHRPGPAPSLATGKIVIAGMGAVSSLGGTCDALLSGLRSAVYFDSSPRLVDDASLNRLLPCISMRRRERLVRMTLLAVAEAIAGAAETRGSARFGLLVGLTRGPAAAYERFFDQALQGRFDITTGRLLLRVGRFSVASEIAHAFGLLGYSGAMAPGVHGGVQLLAHGAEILRASPDLDGLVVVAADEWTGLQQALYANLHLLGNGAAYDPAASGCIGGEGAAAMLLCRRAPAAGDWAAIEGVGFAGDVSARPDSQGHSYGRAIVMALDRAACAPQNIGFAIGQGCGWKLHDQRELAAIARSVPGVPVSSVLSQTGLSESAGGLFGAMHAAATLRGANDDTAPNALLLGSSERGAHAAIVLRRLAA